MAAAYLIFMIAISILAISVLVKSIVTGKKFEPIEGIYSPRFYGQNGLQHHTRPVEEEVK